MRVRLRAPAWLLLAARAGHVAAGTANCPHDNLLRCFIRTPDLAVTFCSWTAGIFPEASTVYETTTLTWEDEPEQTETWTATVTETAPCR